MSSGPTYDPPMTADDPRVCRNCIRVNDFDMWFPIMYAPSGKYHPRGKWGITACGLDATGYGWLWPDVRYARV